MHGRLKRVDDLVGLEKHLAGDPVANAHFLSRAFHSGDAYDIYSTEGFNAVVAVQRTNDHLVFTGNWESLEIPAKLLPTKRFFVSASPPAAVDALKRRFEPAGEWPCWYFIAPDCYGPGEWDSLGPLLEEDVSFIAPFWELGGDDGEEHIRHSVREHDSACVRIDGKPVSWCGLHFCEYGIGNLGFAHTLAEHRRKGLQALATKALVNRLHAGGRRATADVIKDNSASFATCRSLGFEVVGEQSWADFKV
jgi:RimJ/RimL family protein N-acetyltransferase